MTDVKTRKRPAPLMLTPDAEARIASLMAKAPADAIGVKLSTPRRGCSGLAYSVDYVTSANPMDERIDTPGGALFVDGRSRDPSFCPAAQARPREDRKSTRLNSSH